MGLIGRCPTRQAKNCLPDNRALHSAAILRLAFSADGGRLATASVDRTARVVRTPLGRYHGDGTDLIAHQGAVNSVTWSHDSSLLLTAGADRTAHLWSSGACPPGATTGRHEGSEAS